MVVQEKQYLNPNKTSGPFQYQYSIFQDLPALRGQDISGAQQTFNQGALKGNEPIVALQFTGAGQKKFAAVTHTVTTAEATAGSITEPVSGTIDAGLVRGVSVAVS